MKSAMDRWGLALACALLCLWLAPLAAQNTPPPLPKPKPLPPIGQNTIPDPNQPAANPANPAQPAQPAQPAIKPWTPPVYPTGVHTRSAKPGEKLGGDLKESLSLKNEPGGNKLHSSLNIPENTVLDLGTGAKIYCLPQQGEKDTKVIDDGWFMTHGSPSNPCYFGAYSGRVIFQASCAVKAQYTVFKHVDFAARGALLEFSNCLFIDCTLRIEGNAGGELDLNNCTFQEGGSLTALTIVRSVRGPITKIKGLKLDGYSNALVVDAYDAAMARATVWDVKEISFTNITGKPITDSDPLRLDLGRVYLMGEKDTKAAIEKYVEIKTPSNNMKGTPSVNIAGLSPTELTQVGTNIKEPAMEAEEGGDKPTTKPKKTVPDMGDDG